MSWSWTSCDRSFEPYTPHQLSPHISLSLHSQAFWTHTPHLSQSPHIVSYDLPPIEAREGTLAKLPHSVYPSHPCLIGLIWAYDTVDCYLILKTGFTFFVGIAVFWFSSFFSLKNFACCYSFSLLLNRIPSLGPSSLLGNLITSILLTHKSLPLPGTFFSRLLS